MDIRVKYDIHDVDLEKLEELLNQLNQYLNKLCFVFIDRNVFGPVRVRSINVVRDSYSVVYNKSTITGITFDVAGKPKDVVAFLDKLNEAVIKTEQGG